MKQKIMTWTKEQLSDMLIKTMNKMVKQKRQIRIDPAFFIEVANDNGYGKKNISNSVRRRGLIPLIHKYQKKHNLFKTKNHCRNRSCTKLATFFVKDVTHKHGRLAYCAEHKKDLSLKFKEFKNKLKITGETNAYNYYISNVKKIAMLDLKNKKQCLDLIESYYKSDALLEPKFCILLHDLLTLNGGSPIREMPFWLEDHLHYLKPKFADCVDRKLFIAIETKACFFNSQAQSMLQDQLIEYKFYFKGYKTVGVSPDNFQDGTMSLVEFLQLVIKRRKKVYGK